MRVFLDECVDRRFARGLTEHEVKTARQMGWTSIKNGELLELASKNFDVFITVDRNLSFQQRLPSFPIPVMVLHAPTNRLVGFLRLVPTSLDTIREMRPGQMKTVGLSAKRISGSIAELSCIIH